MFSRRVRSATGSMIEARLGMPRSKVAPKHTVTSAPACRTSQSPSNSSKSPSSWLNRMVRRAGSIWSRSDQHRIPLRKLTDHSDSTTRGPSAWPLIRVTLTPRTASVCSAYPSKSHSRA